MISDEILLKIIKEHEVPIIGMLLEYGIVEYLKVPNGKGNKKIYNKFKNVTLTSSLLHDYGLEVVDIAFVKKYNALFPKIRQGSTSNIKVKLQRFVLEYPEHTLQDIYDATESHIKYTSYSSGEQYIPSANNIFYKRENLKGSPEKSMILPILLEYKQGIANAVPDIPKEINLE